MSTKRPKPELSAHFLRELRILEGKDYVQYKARTKELALPDDYKVYHYEPAAGGQPAAYWVGKCTVDKCPVCGTPYPSKAAAELAESKLTHYIMVEREGGRPEISPVTIYLRRIRWRCYECYKERGTYNASMQDDSKITDGNGKTTIQLNKFLGKQAMHIAAKPLAEYFDVAVNTVKKCFDDEVERCDKARNWDNIRTLGLYTIKLNVKGQETTNCLCTNFETEELIELFRYDNAEEAVNFLKSLKDKQAIGTVITSVDGAAYHFATRNFPKAKIMVDRVDIRKRLLDGLETVKKGNSGSPNFPLLRSNWTLLDEIEATPEDSPNGILLARVLEKFPRVRVGYQIKEGGMEIYRHRTGQRQRVDDWIFCDKHAILPYEQLEQCMLVAKEPVIAFAEKYNGVDRNEYEKDVLDAQEPLVRYTDLTCEEESASSSRAALWKTVRAHALYGAAMMVNYAGAQKRKKKSRMRDETFAMNFATEMKKMPDKAVTSETIEPDEIPGIYLHNFGIPLSIYPALISNYVSEYHRTLLDLPALRTNNNEVKKMPRKAKAVVEDTSKMRDVETYTHDDKKRTNNPPVGMAQHDRSEEKVKTYQYDPHLDPTLQWAGKAEGTSFEVPTSSIHIHESIKPLNIIARVTKEYSNAEKGQVEGQISMFAAETPAERMRRRRESIEFYQHGVDWTNRMIAGDSLIIMNSLLEKEGMAGQVQMVYIDPPYGIKYGSNFQPFVDKRDVKDKKDEDLSQEPETIKAFRDTWELGIHSYLSYLRDRLLLARELLADSGSVFIQISDENVHYVRTICDEIFGHENECATIVWKKGTPTAKIIRNSFNYLLWYAKDIEKVGDKVHKLYVERSGIEGSTEDPRKLALWGDFNNGETRPLTTDEKRNILLTSQNAKIFRVDKVIERGDDEDRRFPITLDGIEFTPKNGYVWRGNANQMQRLIEKNRLIKTSEGYGYKFYISDFPAIEITNLWEDTAGKVPNMIYAVQTNEKIIQRCMLMSTDPGDLVLDITCGSGTTAYVAEQWGRRWITCDTSRVAITLAKQRLMTATFDYYKLAHEEQGVGSGFVYKTVPHITLKSIANNEPPAQEILYDQPEIDKTKVRVTGPFTVEALPAPVVKPLDDVLQNDEDVSAKQTDWRDQLLATGIQGRGGARLMFSRVEPLSGTRYLQAEAETKEETPRRAVICFAGETKPLDSRMVALALDEAENLRPAPKLIVFAAFQFDPEAAKDIDSTNWPGVTLLKAQMNTDLMTEDLKKKRSSDQSFWLVGQPDVELIKDGRSKTKFKVKVNGFDYYDVKKGTVESGSTSRIAMWMLDTDYDGMCIEPDMVFFPMGGKKDGWNKLAKTLKTEINMDLIDKYAGSESLWFTAQPNTAIAVKIIDDRGIESLKVIRIGDE